LLASPTTMPSSSAVISATRERSWREICDGPAPKRTSATAFSGTEPPWLDGTLRVSSTDMFSRASSVRRRRIGTWRSPRLYLGRDWSMSPIVATRTAWEIAPAETPARAAWSGLGVTMISGRAMAAVLTTLARPGTPRIWASIARAAASSCGPLSPIRRRV
jgi:hypothetical protein